MSLDITNIEFLKERIKEFSLKKTERNMKKKIRNKKITNEGAHQNVLFPIHAALGPGRRTKPSETSSWQEIGLPLSFLEGAYA